MCSIPFYARDAKRDALASSLVGILERLQACVAEPVAEPLEGVRHATPPSEERLASSQHLMLERIRHVLAPLAIHLFSLSMCTVSLISSCAHHLLFRV